MSHVTAYRCVAEGVDVLSEQAPELPEALKRAMAEGVPYVILDGKVFASDRCAEAITSVKGEPIDAWYFGKARRDGGNVQARTRPDGLPLWAGPVAREGIWSLLKRAMANFAAADLDGLARIVKRKLKKIQYRPHLIDGVPGRYRPGNRTPVTASFAAGRSRRPGREDGSIRLLAPSGE